MKQIEISSLIKTCFLITTFGTLFASGAPQDIPAEPPVPTKTPNVTSDQRAWKTGGVRTEQQMKDYNLDTRDLILRPAIAQSQGSSRFFPKASERHRGNSVPIFMRNNFENFRGLEALRNLRQEQWMEKSLEEIDVQAIRRGAPLRLGELRRSAFRQSADWEYPIDEESYFDISLPDAQESRGISEAIALLARVDIKEAKLADAEDKIRIAMGLAHHLRATPFIICDLVACAQVNITMSAVEELIQHPESSNYYWDLTSIPRPFIESKKSIPWDAEQDVHYIRNFLKSAPGSRSMDELQTEEEWNEALSWVCKRCESNMNEPPQDSEKLLNELKKIARVQLPQWQPEGANKIKDMCDAEVLIRYWDAKAERLFGPIYANTLLENEHGVARAAAAYQRAVAECNGDPWTAEMIPGWFISPPFGHADQRIALLRIVEAIRDWSGKHDGRLPESLNDLDLAVPLDRMTHRPYRYSLSEDHKVASLRSNIYPSGSVLPRVLEYRILVDSN